MAVAWEKEIENKMITDNILSNFPIISTGVRIIAVLAKNVFTFHKD